MHKVINQIEIFGEHDIDVHLKSLLVIKSVYVSLNKHKLHLYLAPGFVDYSHLYLALYLYLFNTKAITVAKCQNLHS